jgi:centractin
VRSIKESACYVAFNPSKEEEMLDTSDKSSKPLVQKFKLPDGNVIELGSERFKATEAMFYPDLIGEEHTGVHEMLAHAIQRSDLDLRKTLYSNIVLAGGNTLFPGTESILCFPLIHFLYTL